LLFDRRGREIARGTCDQQGFGLLGRQPLRAVRRSGTGQRQDLLAQQGLALASGLKMKAQARHHQPGAHAHGRGGDDAAARRHQSGLACRGIERLIERPTGQTLDDGTGASQIERALGERQIETAAEGLVPTDGLTQSTRGFRAQMHGQGLAMLLHRDSGGVQDRADEARDIRRPRPIAERT
jgi:hypothetical protein